MIMAVQKSNSETGLFMPESGCQGCLMNMIIFMKPVLDDADIIIYDSIPPSRYSVYRIAAFP